MAFIPIPLVRDFLVGEYGLVTMALSYGIAIVMPIVLTFFLAFSILEDSGYLPRLAVMANRPFEAMGLNGKAVLPMALGLGCDTMATLTTRILETRKERVQTTLLLALGVPCSAQLGVLMGMAAILTREAIFVWLSVVLLTLFSVGWLAARVLPGKRSDFILELPPVRRPQPYACSSAGPLTSSGWTKRSFLWMGRSLPPSLCGRSDACLLAGKQNALPNLAGTLLCAGIT